MWCYLIHGVLTLSCLLRHAVPCCDVLCCVPCSTSHALSTVKHKTVDPVAGAVGSAASAVSHSAHHTKDAIVGKGECRQSMPWCPCYATMLGWLGRSTMCTSGALCHVSTALSVDIAPLLLL